MEVLPYSWAWLPMSVGSTFQNQSQKVELNSSTKVDAQQVYKETQQISEKKNQEVDFLSYGTSGNVQNVKWAVWSIINTKA